MPKFSSHLESYDIHSASEYYDQAFSRNIGLLTRAEQKKLKRAKIAIPGMGGVGGLHLITMVRSGVGNFHISDFDVFEPVNINRQYGAHTGCFGKPKLDVMKEQALLINPHINIKTFPHGIKPDNIDAFLEGVDVVLDGLDFFCFDIRRQLFKRAREKGIYVVTAGPMGFSSALLVFAPNQGMGFDEYFNIVENMSPEEKSLSFALGLAPRATHIKYMDFSTVNLKQEAGPSLNVACQICAGMAGTEALRIILNRKGLKPVPHYFQFDPFLMKLRKGKLHFGNRNPIQRMKIGIVKKMIESRKNKAPVNIPEIPQISSMEKTPLPEKALRYLVMAGIQAPSGDNAQPWKFSITDNQVSVWIDPDADHSFFNVNQIASIISCGAAIENINVAAGLFGVEPEIELKDNLSGIGARIHFKPMAHVQKDPLHEFIWKRHTNRTMFRRESFSKSALNLIDGVISGFPGAKLHVVTQREDIKKLAKIVYTIDRIRTEHRSLHEHLMKMIRFSPGEVEKTGDGLPLKNLQAGPAGEIFLKISKPWAVMNAFNNAGIGRMVAFHSYQGIINSSAVILLTVEGSGNKDFLVGGRALERVWLELTRQGYHIQPMTAITLFFMRLFLNQGRKFMQKHKDLLNSVREDYFKLFRSVDAKNGQVMLFRVGHGRPIRHFTRRKGIESFLI
ncbi:ThiF family adenylyltransferase [Desulfobacter postgatei]|uniref:Dinucleotide-utilizing enzyme possibly involved in molybdopterin or thiamin biosynthesis n=1 Tax=Desulfobacter postgatei 2ac9 TaxID=879212 RepID=I5B2U9_9BACT|nr:ThiF family adenylyltransferase [Desulfobacter postgatei]EIM63812.1 dinucleotide-utilizing enzyme possibly involved in molybdopterin or thiamin biosynthesis [Desulfobacter postgatei 2ac9]